MDTELKCVDCGDEMGILVGFDLPKGVEAVCVDCLIVRNEAAEEEEEKEREQGV